MTITTGRNYDNHSRCMTVSKTTFQRSLIYCNDAFAYKNKILHIMIRMLWFAHNYAYKFQ